MMMCAKTFLTDDTIEDIDPASDYEQLIGDD